MRLFHRITAAAAAAILASGFQEDNDAGTQQREVWVADVPLVFHSEPGQWLEDDVIVELTLDLTEQALWYVAAQLLPCSAWPASAR